MLRKLGIFAVTIFCVAGLGFAVALAATTGDTGTNVSCATATASTPDHVIGVDGTDVDTISGTTTTASDCETQTYTIPTNTVTQTETDTATVTQTVTAQPSSSTSSTTTSSSSSSTTTSTTSSGPPPPPAGCTVILSALGQINQDLTNGATVCLTAGSYGSLSITANPGAAGATLTAAPGAHVSLSGISLSGGNITVTQLHSTGGITITAGNGYTINHDDVSNAKGYGIAVLAPIASPSNGDVISGNKVHDTSTTGEGDALRFDGVKNLTITGNDIYSIKECPALNCHTDTMQFYNANTPVSGVTITRNYIHDCTDAQGVPFLKDADYSNVTITDNLELRMSSAGELTGMQLYENTSGMIVRNNTYWATSGSNASPQGSSASPSLLLDHNVFDQFNMTPSKYPITESDNVFGQSPWSWSKGASDRVITSPSFMNTSTDDYRLVGYNDPLSANNGVGIDWAPAAQSYGPSN